jgi:hypothetical protein
MSGPRSYAYRLPRAADKPTADGRHSATVNVMHCAENFARFPGCGDCQRMAETSCPVCFNILSTSTFGDFDPVTETFDSHVYHSSDGCGSAACELCAKYQAGWCQTCGEFTRPAR